jgi:hypothetical protein
MDVSRYLPFFRNCFWLLVPILVFDTAFTSLLPTPLQPQAFWRDIPGYVAWPENVLRVVVLALPLLLPLEVVTRRQRAGFALYVAGVLLYVAAWGLLILAPESPIARTPAAFLAPAYTPLLWLAGIALVGDRLFVSRIPWRWWIYLLLAALFVSFHVGHAALVYGRVIDAV